jgi:UDP-N-acetylglucosamine--N-acetylmuramyl-(pentapeptide) pyrophosphoryl-undecaprenol N-acetylglucosamine transferase
VKVVVAGGGTAGHVFPAIAVGEELRDRGWEVSFIGTARGQEASLVPAAGFPFVPVAAEPAQTRLSLVTVGALLLAVRSARSLRPVVAAADAVVGVGGFASASAVLAARSTRRPLVLVEPNSVPGLVNRIASRWAAAVATTFEAAAERLPHARRIERTGNPIRRAILAAATDRARLRAAAREAFDLEEGRGTVLVTGGSQGALRIDVAVAEAQRVLSDRRDLQLLVATGPAHERVVAEAIDPRTALRVRVHGFIERMDLALAAADLVVARAGASVAEVAACGIPSVLVPYPHATEHHQDANAREVSAAGAAVVVADDDLTGERLAGCILELMDDPDRRKRMGEAARAWARPDAAARVARLVEEVAGA